MAIMAARRGMRLMNRGKNGTTLVRAAVLGGPAVPVRKTRLSRRTSVVLAALASLALGQTAHAQTVGNDAEGGSAYDLLALVGGGAVPQPGNDPVNAVDFNSSLFGYIANPYIMVGIGNGGSYSLNYAQNFNATFNVSGILTFGNRIGSSRVAGDDNKPLNTSGFGLGEVFPVPGETEVTTGGFTYYAYPSYVRAQVDGTNVNVVAPTSRFQNNALVGTADIGSNVTLRQEIRLYRTQAQLRWIITNADTAASHTVNLRFVVNHGGTGRNVGDIFGGPFYTPGANFYEDPVLGQTNRASVINAADVPTTLALYGARYEDPSGNVYAGRHTFRGSGATPPSRVVIANAFEMRPRLAGFDITPERLPGNEIGVASFFGPYTLAPGQSQTIITYYGNATPSERLDNDFVTSLDGPEALGYNAAAASASGVAGNTSATVSDQGVQFLTPNPFQIFAGIYNRVPANPSDKLDLTGVNASLTLPDGLAFATVPGTTTADTSRKVLGSSGVVLSDRGSDTSWYVRPTGAAFGSLTYQVSIATQELGGRQQTRSINIPAVPFRSVTSAGFQMIGFPFSFDPVTSNNGDPATVVNSLTRPEDSPVSFYQWVPNPAVPGDGAYQIVTQLQNGIGYMYRPQIDRTIFAKGVYPQSQQADATTVDISAVPQRQIILERGWNMISNPYVYDIPMRALRFATATDDSVGGVTIPNVSSQTFSNANSSGLIRGGVFNLDVATGGYVALDATTASLRPWEAYWIYAVNRSILVYPLPTQRQSIVVPPSDGSSPVTRKPGKTNPVVTTPVTASTLDNWSLQLVAKRNDSVDKSVLIGTSNKNEPETTRAMPKPPVPMAKYVYVGIVKDTKGTKYYKDIRTGRGTQTWNMEVSSDSDGPVTLSWPNIGQLSRRLNLKIKDTTTGRIFSMRSSSSLTLNVTKAQPTKLEVTSAVESSTPLAINGVQIVPGGRATGGARDFAFRITRDATVRATITTITGKSLATVAGGRTFTRGQGSIHWDGRAQDGSILPPGPYRLELVAQDSEGNVAPISQVFMTTQ